MRIPRIVISASNSGCGKTMIACGIARALRREGFKVQTFKVGPDFLDPKYLTLASGRKCVNLDSWIMNESTLLKDFEKYSSDADIAIIEGVRSLYDSADPLRLKGSTFSVAKLLRAPIILVVDIRGVNLGAAAIVKGFTSLFNPEIKGVILNFSRGKSHELKTKKAIERLLDIKVIGTIPEEGSLSVKMRHLGLTTVEEMEKEAENLIERWREIIESRVNINSIIEIAESTGELPQIEARREKELYTYDVSIAVAYDKSFNFYYTQNLDILRDLGAKIIFFNTIAESQLPQVDGFLIGGGYPELYASMFSESISDNLKRKIEEGYPTYAECGGLMYLCRSILGRDGRKYKGVGVIPAEAIFDLNKRFLGYVRGRVIGENVLMEKGRTFRGHEFHYSFLDIEGDVRYAYELSRGYGIDGKHDGIVVHNTLASYTHLLFSGNKKALKRFLGNCIKFRSK